MNASMDITKQMTMHVLPVDAMEMGQLTVSVQMELENVLAIKTMIQQTKNALDAIHPMHIKMQLVGAIIVIAIRLELLAKKTAMLGVFVIAKV